MTLDELGVWKFSGDFGKRWEKTRSYAEFELLNYLNQQGINVPRPIAARAVRQLIGYKADILVEKIPQAKKTNGKKLRTIDFENH